MQDEGSARAGHLRVRLGIGCHVSAGAVVSSVIKIGNFADICLATVIREKVTMGDYAVAGAGALVLKDIPAGEIHVGFPAKFSRKVEGLA